MWKTWAVDFSEKRAFNKSCKEIEQWWNKNAYQTRLVFLLFFYSANGRSVRLVRFLVSRRPDVATPKIMLSRLTSITVWTTRLVLSAWFVRIFRHNTRLSRVRHRFCCEITILWSSLSSMVKLFLFFKSKYKDSTNKIIAICRKFIIRLATNHSSNERFNCFYYLHNIFDDVLRRSLVTSLHIQ